MSSATPRLAPVGKRRRVPGPTLGVIGLLAVVFVPILIVIRREASLGTAGPAAVDPPAGGNSSAAGLTRDQAASPRERTQPEPPAGNKVSVPWVMQEAANVSVPWEAQAAANLSSWSAALFERTMLLHTAEARAKCNSLGSCDKVNSHFLRTLFSVKMHHCDLHCIMKRPQALMDFSDPIMWRHATPIAARRDVRNII
jgi:hypothetical protein